MTILSQLSAEISHAAFDTLTKNTSQNNTMGDITAGYHVGSKADDADAALRKTFTDRDCQIDGLATILRYCQVQAGYSAGDTDASGMLRVIESQFPRIVTIKYQPTTFMKYLGKGDRSMPSISDLVNHLPNNTRLTQWLNSIPEYGSYNRSIIQLFTEVEGDYLSFYTVSIWKSQNDERADSSVSFSYNSVDRDEMANNADWLVSKLNVKEDIDHWANGISSDGYKY